MAAPRRTLAQYLQWAALKPRTSEWSALVAYDRGQCNRLLLQEYIEKHDKHSLMPPINEAYRTGESTWSWLLDYVTDAPRLSFENNPGEQSAEVNMSVAIVGGKKVTLDDVAGQAQVKKISSFDPLDFPRLEAERVLLKDVQGSVSKGGEVLLDLGDPDSQRHRWQVTGDGLEHERLVAGAFFKRKFREADPVRRTFSLGTLAPTTQEFMKPQSFKLRTVMEEGAARLGAANYGDGAIEMRIAMDDELQGGLPGEDWIYPLPSDRPDLNALMMFGSRFFMHGIVGKGTARVFNAPDAQFDSRTDHRGFVEWLGIKSGTEGYLEVPPFEADVGGRRVTFRNYKLPIYISQDHRLSMTLYRGADGSLSLGVGMGNQNSRRLMLCTVNGVSFHCLMGLGFSGTYRFSFDRTSRRLQVKLATFHSAVDYYPNPLLPLDVAAYMYTPEFKNGLGDLVGLAVMQIFNGLEAVDVFTLNTLFFNAENAVQLETVDLIGEMLLFGTIGPRVGTFAIDPLEIMLSHGQTHRFRTIPETLGVRWVVEDLEGNTTGVGQMNANSGAYIAPSLAEIQGTYKRIKVIATSPGNSNSRHISRALVTVVARAITLNPLVETCNFSPETTDETRELSAHGTNGTLRWRVNGDGRINETADEHGKNTYRAPPKRVPGVPTFTIDEVVVENTATGQQQSCLIVVNHHGQMIAVSVELNNTLPHHAKLIATVGGQPLTEALTWSCLPAEAGSIDSTHGVFTASEVNSSQFVVITVLMERGGIKFDGFTILPLPLAPFPPKPAPEILLENTRSDRACCRCTSCTDGLANSSVERSANPFIS